MPAQENLITRSIIDASVKIHQKLGPGLLESVYERVLAYELRKRGHTVDTQVPIAITYDKHQIDDAFRADLVIDHLVIIELKSLEIVKPVHKKQLLTYLRLSDKRVGLLLNFGTALMKNGITRIANGVKEE